MKKILVLALIATFGFFSCGGDDKKDGDKKNGDKKKDAFTVCDCVNGVKALEKKYDAAQDDPSKLKELENEFKELEEKCNQLEKEKTKEELEEEAEKC